MLVETSAIVAILLEEPEAGDFLARLNAAERPATSIVNKIEAALAVGRAITDYPLATRLVAEFLNEVGVTILPVPVDIYDDVMAAYAAFGKGVGHKAQLNFGDCFSYAFAKRAATPLLFKGNDFAQTDLGNN